MNLIFLFIGLVSVYLLTLGAHDVLTVMLSGINGACALALKLFGIYAVWLSVLKVIEGAGLDKSLANALSKITSKLFPNEKKNTYSALTLNLSANIIGMGGASTPMGIKAMQTMESKKNRIMLVVINATSIQLIPTTIVALRASYGSATDIILPSLIATVITSTIGIVLVKLLVKNKESAPPLSLPIKKC